MSLGNILVAKGLVSNEDLQRANETLSQNGGRLADCLVSLGLVTAEQIEAVEAEVPGAPANVEETGLDPVFLLQLMAKGMYMENLETPSQIAKAVKLPNSIVNALLKDAVDRKLAEAIGQSDNAIGALAEMRYSLSRAGRDWAMESMEHCQYFGPAPVSLEDYKDRVMRQRITNEQVNQRMLDKAFESLTIPERFLDRLGPAINSGTAILIYGAAGNGKTTIAQTVGQIFEDVVFIPHCFEVDGQIVKVFDPSIHQMIESAAYDCDSPRGLRRDRIDSRWVPCYRPMLMTGGELTLEMLDFKFNEIGKFYEAPMHIKALNGTFLIDDFGRQLAKPEDILNRWIVPLNNRVDYLKLHTGKSFQLPFDELVIFSTNLRPNDLMDPAFQRRIAYKLETLEPSEELFREVFRDVTATHQLSLAEEVYRQVVDGIRANGSPLAYYQPKFVVEQVLASCKYKDMKPQFTPENVEDALLNLFVNEDNAPAPHPPIRDVSRPHDTASETWEAPAPAAQAVQPVTAVG